MGPHNEPPKAEGRSLGMVVVRELPGRGVERGERQSAQALERGGCVGRIVNAPGFRARK